ncbi:hypothetical protein K503DRAFT_805633 [Rhizopogon vinicolor AM-OR11-026]|uniref:Uncharacterized protein n=1 Tax=Rhizopogon vinicolor AM-OR11-026 TaxID=1314800 RepID=A0A1B7MH81_9AGAM|nr:hypothetical protein K503DRAFT_805633 [Rhizopogon vinicolor AM-OR11-026]
MECSEDIVVTLPVSFYFTPDANFDPANVFQERFADVKLNCRLTAGRDEAFKYSSEDFPAVLDNLRALEKLVPKERDYETQRHSRDARSAVDQTHTVCSKQKLSNEDQDGGHHDNEDSSESTTTADSIGSDFNIATWPVADRCKGHCQDLISTHEIRPLPAYDGNHALIPPLQYESKLKGALVEVHTVAIYHHRFKSKTCDVFNMVLRELIVLSPPAAMPSGPFKCRRLNTGPSTEQRNKGKEALNLDFEIRH